MDPDLAVIVIETLAYHGLLGHYPRVVSSK